MLNVLGQGTFGKVYLASAFNKQYAIKILRKDKILTEEWALEKTKQEKEILLKTKHQFIINTEYVFSDPIRIYFVMKFAQGGDLFNHLKK